MRIIQKKKNKKQKCFKNSFYKKYFFFLHFQLISNRTNINTFLLTRNPVYTMDGYRSKRNPLKTIVIMADFFQHDIGFARFPMEIKENIISIFK